MGIRDEVRDILDAGEAKAVRDDVALGSGKMIQGVHVWMDNER